MLFEYRADPHRPAYNVTRRYTIAGDVDLGRLDGAIRDVVDGTRPAAHLVRRRLASD